MKPDMQKKPTQTSKYNVLQWCIRFVKGAFIGTGFILPGVSGGALAAIFGLYEPLIHFLAHLTRKFWQNVRFFLPVGLGMLAGIVLLSYPLDYFLNHYLAPTMWFFIGAILGTFPALWRQAGNKGRKGRHIAIMLVSAAAGAILLRLGEQLLNGQVPLNFGTWILAGAIIALGVLIPGLSPSNFLLYMGMYTPMVEAFKNLDFAVLAPLAIGAVACFFALAKLIDLLFEKVYTGLFHIILGVVIASTLVIIPLDYNYLSWGALACLLSCAAGAALGYWMSLLDKRPA